MAMDQYLYIPFLVGWTSIYQLFWCSLGARVLTHPHFMRFREISATKRWEESQPEKCRQRTKWTNGGDLSHRNWEFSCSLSMFIWQQCCSMDWFNGYFLSNPNVSWENSMVPCGFPLDGLMSPICTQVFRWTNHPGDTITGEERDDGERVLDDGRERRDHHQVGCLRSSNMACWTFPHLVQWCYHANLHLVQEMSQLAMFDDTRGYIDFLRRLSWTQPWRCFEN